MARYNTIFIFLFKSYYLALNNEKCALITNNPPLNLAIAKINVTNINKRFGMRKDNMKNIQRACCANGLYFTQYDDKFIIENEFEQFTFRFTEQNVWLVEKRLRISGNYGVVKYIDLAISAKPGKIMKLISSQCDIKTSDKYMRVCFDELSKYNKNEDLQIELKFDKIFIRTKAEEFYLMFDEQDRRVVKLMHRGYKGAGRTLAKHNNEYHEQFSKMIDPKNILSYITEHTRKRYGVM